MAASRVAGTIELALGGRAVLSTAGKWFSDRPTLRRVLNRRFRLGGAAGPTEQVKRAAAFFAATAHLPGGVTLRPRRPAAVGLSVSSWGLLPGGEWREVLRSPNAAAARLALASLPDRHQYLEFQVLRAGRLPRTAFPAVQLSLSRLGPAEADQLATRLARAAGGDVSTKTGGGDRLKQLAERMARAAGG